MAEGAGKEFVTPPHHYGLLLKVLTMAPIIDVDQPALCTGNRLFILKQNAPWLSPKYHRSIAVLFSVMYLVSAVVFRDLSKVPGIFEYLQGVLGVGRIMV